MVMTNRFKGWDKVSVDGLQKNKSKYGNQRVEIDGIKFQSKREATRYQELKILEKAGVIKDLKLQVPFELNQGGTHSVKYKADFTYTEVETGLFVVEDVKGYRNRTYEKKKRLMKRVWGIAIKET